MTATWPSGVPTFSVLNMEHEAANVMLRTQADAGVAKQRRRFTGAARPLRAMVRCTRDQKNRIEAWFDHTLQGGALEFEYRNLSQDLTSGLSGFNSAFQFNADGQFIEIPDSDYYSFSTFAGQFCIEFWLKTRDNTGPQGVLCKGATPASYEYAIRKADGGTVLLFAMWDTNDQATGLFSDGCDIPDNEWHHYAWTGDGSDSYLYRDGVLVSGPSALTGGDDDAIDPTTAPLEVGRYIDPAGQEYYLDGMLDDLRIWNVYRNAAAIAATKDAELVGDESGLVGYWKFNEQSGPTIGDSSPIDNDGTKFGGQFYPEVRNYRFTAPPKFTMVSGDYVWDCQMELEVLP